MKAIRGATTVDFDGCEQIRERVKELLLKIRKANNLDNEDIICIMFSNTSDIRSFYPAKAAREAGFASAPLFSSLEPEIEGSLKLCIRVMLLTDKEDKPVHVYLHGAKNLRRDITERLNIAIDGPAGSGKSTVSRLIAKQLDILCLDTGAMYRACALKCVNEGISCTDGQAVDGIINDINIEVKYENGVQHTYLDGADVSQTIREPKISMLASAVSAIGNVRNKMVELQRKIAAATPCVLDGRDIGTNVLPNAKFKFYLSARPEIRAKRRQAENEGKGIFQPYDEILADIKKRDEQDKNREIAPLKRAEDAVYVDSSDMNIEEVTAFIINKIQERI